MSTSKVVFTVVLTLTLIPLLIACSSEEPTPAPVATSTTAVPTLMATAEIPTAPTQEIINNEPQATEPTDSATVNDTPNPTNTPIPIEISTTGELTDVDLVQSRILFLERDDFGRQYQLVSMKPDGSDVRLLSDNLGTFNRETDRNAFVTLLDWSSDGRWAVISNSDEGGYLLRTDGSQEIIPLPEGYVPDAAWSPDNTQIALVAEGGLQLFNILDGTQTAIPLPLTDPERASLAVTIPFVRYQGISWAPDGSWFAVQVIGTNDLGQTATGVYRYDLASDTVTLLHEENAFGGQMRRSFEFVSGFRTFPAVSPDGSFVLTDAAGQGELFLIPADGSSEPISIWNGRLPIYSVPQWSPTGEWIAFVYSFDVYLLRPDGSEWINITNSDSVDETQVQWSPDGSELLFVTKTGRDVYDLQRYDLATGQLTPIRIDNPYSLALSQTDAQWQWFDETQLAELEQAPLILDIIVAQEGQLPEPSPTLPAPPPELAIDAPEPLMNPVWWRKRFFNRRPIVLTTEKPIEVGHPDQMQTPLVQITLDPTLVRPSLNDPEITRNVRVAWWNKETGQWHELPFELTNLSGETALLTFPLQADLPAGTTDDAYYLYYGLNGNPPNRENPFVLDEAYLGRDLSGLRIGSFYQLDQQEEDLDIGAATWSEAFNGRSVVSLAEADSVTMIGYVSPGQSTLSFMVNPTATSGQLFTFRDERTQTGIADTPFISYDGNALQITFLTETFSLPLTLPQNEWSHVLLTWSSGDTMALYLNGQEVASIPYTPEYPEGATLSVTAPRLDNRLVLGAADGSAGLAGQYANVYMFGDHLTAADVNSFYIAQTQVTGLLSETDEQPVVSTQIGTNGGAVLSADGQSWVYFAPNTFDQPTDITLLLLNGAAGTPNELTAFALHQGDLREQFSTQEDIRAFYSGGLPDDGSLPENSATIYYRFDPTFVESPEDTLFIQLDPASGLIPIDADFVNPTSSVVMNTSFNAWGIVIIERRGVGGLNPR